MATQPIASREHPENSIALNQKTMEKSSQGESPDHHVPTESARFWRLNSIDALKMKQNDESLAKDPEHLDAIKANSAELAQLQAKEG